MVKKFKQMAQEYAASRAALLDTALSAQVKDSAQQIWLAGMGAFARAQAQGTKVFEALVKEGTTLQQKTQSAAEDRLSEASHKINDIAGDVQARAGQQWDKLEGIFEARTAKALSKLCVPSARDVDALQARIDALSAQVKAMSQPAPAPAPTPRARPKAAAESTAKSAVKAAAKPAAKTSPPVTPPARKRVSPRKPSAT